MNGHHEQDSNWLDEEGFRLLVEGVREFAIFLLSPERVILTWNEGVADILGYSREEFVGQSGDIIFTEKDRAEGAPVREVEATLKDGQARDERWHVRKDGSSFWASGMVTKVCDSSGKLLGVSKVMADRTDQKNAQELLRQAHDELETRIAGRTRELSEALESLKGEIAQREELEIALLEASEKERERLGQELHDGACQHLQGTALIASVLARKLPRAEAQELRTIEQLIRDGSELVRYVARGLNPFVLHSIGLKAALSDLAEYTSKVIPCHLEYSADIDVGDGPALHLFRIAQEAVTNSMKHSGATAITISFSKDSGRVELRVVDNGKGGAERLRDVSGMGLHNMRQRARLLNGILEVENLSSGGTRVTCLVPGHALTMKRQS